METVDDLLSKLSAQDLEAARAEAAARYVNAREEVKVLNEALALQLRSP